MINYNSSDLRMLSFLLVCLFLMSCSAKYPIVSVEYFEKMDTIPHKQYIVIQNVMYDETNQVPSDVQYVISLLKKNSMKETEAYIKEMADSEYDKNSIDFCKGLFCFYKKDYTQSISFLENTQIKEYVYLKHLLIGDCMLEINKSSERFSEKEILSQYQLAMDNCFSETIKEVIKIHVKFAKYGE